MVEILTCRSCEEQFEYDKNNRGDARRTICATCHRRENRLRRYEEIVEYGGGECQKCGYSACYAALDFHHINPEEKEFGVNSKNVRTKWERVKKEADKCILLCANCHREEECSRENCDAH